MQNPIFNQVWWIIGLPLIGFLIQCFFGKNIIQSLGEPKGKRVVGFLAVAAVASSFAVGVAIIQALAAQVDHDRAIIQTGVDWMRIAGISIPFELRIDPLSMTMVMVITGIGSLIHLYATGYMAEEKDYPRFFAYLNLFIAFMLMLVLGNNLALLFIGWEGVGLCSYLLIGFWYKDFANSIAANKAFIVNRIGDVGLSLGMFLIVALLAKQGVADPRYLSYDVIFSALPEVIAKEPMWATAIALCLFVGACGKSAQFPLYLWLPDAMAGPTPVSALIHAATMVTAGVVLLTRMQLVFIASPVASAVVVIVGLFTAVFAALIAFGQTDIKKVLAYSTVSQLGFMFIACGVGAYWVGMFHVITHAFFKALLFLGSGAVIHAMSHDQDMRNYGNLSRYIPITCGAMTIGWIAIAGVPLTSGWFSKEEILHQALYSHQAMLGGVNVGLIAGLLGFAAALLTAVYMTRMMMLTFWGGEERWRLIPAKEGHQEREVDHHGHSSAHAGHPDDHDFFYSESELAAQPHEHEHHHELDENHKPHEVPVSMWFPLVILALFSAGSGLWLKGSEWFASIPKDRLQSWLEPHAHEAHHGPAPILGMWLPILGMWLGIAGIAIGALWYWRGLPKSEGWDLARWNPIRRAAGNQFGYDAAMMNAGIEGGGTLGNWLWRTFDSKIIDGAVNGIGGLLSGMAKGFGWIQSGYARGYALMMLVGCAGILGWIVYAVNNFGGKG